MSSPAPPPPRRSLRRRLLRFVAAAALLVVAVVAGLFWWCRSPGAPCFPEPIAARPLQAPFRTWAEHDAIYAASDRPYVVSMRAGDGALEYVGVTHCVGRDHPDQREIVARWRDFEPTVALCEGRARGHMTAWPLSLLPQGEPAIVHELARGDGVPIYSLEPDYEREVAALLEHEPAERVALYFALRVYWNEAGGVADEGLFVDLLRKRSQVEGLRGVLDSIEHTDRVWAELVAEHGDWRTRRAEPQGTWIAALSERSRIVRGLHMVALLQHLVERGERVFAVVGRSHVIRHEPSLRAAMGSPTGG